MTTKLYETRVSIPAKSRKKIVAMLNQNLADLSDLYSQTKHAHWNVVGPRFYQIHKLCDELAKIIENHVDVLAERITALGGVAMGTVRMAAAASRLEEFPTENKGDLEYLVALVDRYGASATAVRQAIDEADEQEDAGTADLMTDIVRDLDKALYFLEAHLRS